MNGAAIVTGAAQGMGRSFALRLARDGYAIAAVDVQAEKARETVACILAQQGRAHAYIADLSDVPAIEPLVVEIERDLGMIEILVNNAGIVKTQPLLNVTKEDWDQIMGINARGLFFLLQAVGRRMVARHRGSIINIGSVAARSARPKQTVYGASKAAVLHLTKSAAAVFGPAGVRVNAVCPGVIDTPMTQAVQAARTREEVGHILESIPLQRMADADEVAEVVAFLASDRSSYVNGQAINVCGGIEMD
jgi:NAD(P)-dependent dehydrogenase (short-subunit alcohol dehydrogenase family)